MAVSQKTQKKPALEVNKPPKEVVEIDGLIFKRIDMSKIENVMQNGWLLTYADVSEAAEKLFNDTRVGEYFFEGVCKMLGINVEEAKQFDATTFKTHYDALCASGFDSSTAGQIATALNPAYWAIQYMVNLAYRAYENKSQPNDFVINRIIYYFANPVEEGGLGKDAFGNEVTNVDPQYFGHRELKKNIWAIYAEASKKVEKAREEKLKNIQSYKIFDVNPNLNSDVKIKIPPSSSEGVGVLEVREGEKGGMVVSKSVKEGGERELVLDVSEKQEISTAIFSSKYLETRPSLKNLLEWATNTKTNTNNTKCDFVRYEDNEYIVDVDKLVTKREELEKKTLKELTPEDLHLMYLIPSIQLEINLALEYVFKLCEKAAKDGPQHVDKNKIPSLQNMTTNILSSISPPGVPPAAVVEAVNASSDGVITNEEGKNVERALGETGLSFDDVLDELKKERDKIEEKLKRVESLMAILEVQKRIEQASDLNSEFKNYYPSADIKEAVERYQKDLRIYAMAVEKEEEWKKYFERLRQAYDYAKSKKPPALKRFIRELSEITNHLTEMTRKLELMDRVCGYSLLRISLFSEGINNAGSFFTMPELLRMRLTAENFSNFVKEEKRNILKLGPDVTPTLAFFGIFELKKGKLSFSHNGSEYLNAWCKENNYDIYKMKDELLVEFSNGLLSSFGQSFLAFAVRKAMEDSRISVEDKEMFNDVRTRTEAARVLLSERAKELGKKIRELGSESLVMDTDYAGNYLNAMQDLQNLQNLA